MILSHFIIIIQVCFQGNLKLKQTLCPVRRHSFRNIHNEANIIILQTKMKSRPQDLNTLSK